MGNWTLSEVQLSTGSQCWNLDQTLEILVLVTQQPCHPRSNWTPHLLINSRMETRNKLQKPKLKAKLGKPMLSASSWWMGLVNAKRHRSQNCNGSRQTYLRYRVSNCGNVRQWRATSSKSLLVSLQKATRVTIGVRKQNQTNAVEMTMLWPMALTQQHVFHLELPRSCCSSIPDLTLIVMISAKYQSTFSCFFPWGRKIVFKKEGTGVFAAVQHVKPPPGISCKQ